MSARFGLPKVALDLAHRITTEDILSDGHSTTNAEARFVRAVHERTLFVLGFLEESDAPSIGLLRQYYANVLLEYECVGRVPSGTVSGLGDAFGRALQVGRRPAPGLPSGHPSLTREAQGGRHDH